MARRQLIVGGAAAAMAVSAAARLPIVVNQDLGPFYPLTRPLDQDADLTAKQVPAGDPREALIARLLAGTPVPTFRWDIAPGVD